MTREQRKLIRTLAKEHQLKEIIDEIKWRNSLVYEEHKDEIDQYSTLEDKIKSAKSILNWMMRA